VGSDSKNGVRHQRALSPRLSMMMMMTLVQLMGRTVNLHYLVSQRINSTLLRSLDVAISRFEALGFSSVVVSTDSSVCHFSVKVRYAGNSFCLQIASQSFCYLSICLSVLYRLRT